MSEIEGVESLKLLPDRLAIAEFSAVELKTILGESADRDLSRQNFNWMGAYLVEEVGLHEGEVAEWFKSGAASLGDARPLDVWSEFDGFEEVFNYARSYKGLVGQALKDEGIDIEEDPLARSHGIAHSALDIIWKGFQSAEVALQAAWDSSYMKSRAITTPGKENSPVVRWKGNQTMEDYRITYKEGDKTDTYYIVRYLGNDAPGMILQSGIVEYIDGERVLTESDSDLDGRPPAAGEVAEFVIPLANEVKNKTLAQVTH